MSFSVPPVGKDDLGFLAKVNHVFTRIVARVRPRDVFVVQTADCFGDRWCATGGTFLGARDAQTVVSRDAPMLPPFPPDRVASERAWHLALDFTSYIVSPDSETLHVHGLKGREFQRELSMFTEAGVFLWYSGGTLEGDRGTVMVQVHTPEVGDLWHATLARTRNGWEFLRGLGISKEAFED